MSLSFLLFVEAGNNRVAVYFNQGVWLPPSAREIELGRRMLGVGRYALDESDWLPVPPALAEGLPIALKLQSLRGDFMVLQAAPAGHGAVRVELSTDWN